MTYTYRTKGSPSLERAALDASQLLRFIVKRQPNMSNALRRGLEAIADDLEQAVPVPAKAAKTDDDEKFVLECDICATDGNADYGEWLPQTKIFICDDCSVSPDKDIQELIIAALLEEENSDWGEQDQVGADSTAIVKKVLHSV